MGLFATAKKFCGTAKTLKKLKGVALATPKAVVAGGAPQARNFFGLRRAVV